MISTYYLLDKRAAYKASKSVPLLADIRYQHNSKSEHFRFSTGLTCNPKNFGQQEIHGREPNSDQKKAMMKNISQIAERIYYDGISKGQLPDRDTFKLKIKQLLTDARVEKTTLDYLSAYIGHLTAREKSRATVLGMERLKSLLEEIQTKGISIAFDSMDLEFETVILTMLQKKKFNTNTKGSYIKRLKMFLNWCVKNNFTRNLVFKQFEITEEAREIVSLSETEVETIANLNLPKHKGIEKGMRLTRDWFIVATQTGLRFSDLHKVKPETIKHTKDGYDLHVTQKKTGNPVVIPISRLLYKILKEYDFALPSPVSNQKFNENLKAIAVKVGIDKEITSHVGRKTFCTIQYRKNVPVPWIMKISGHRTEKDFYLYVGVQLTENSSLVRGKNSDFIIEHEPKMVVNS